MSGHHEIIAGSLLLSVFYSLEMQPPEQILILFRTHYYYYSLIGI